MSDEDSKMILDTFLYSNLPLLLVERSHDLHSIEALLSRATFSPNTLPRILTANNADTLVHEVWSISR